MSEWYEAFIYFSPIDLEGNRITGPTPVMMRKISETKYEYRKMTEEEARKWHSLTA